MTKIYRESFSFFLSSFPALLIFAALIEGALWILQPRSETAITFVALTVIAYYFHRHFLFGENLTFGGQPAIAEGAPPVKFGWFILLSAALVGLPFGLATLIALQGPLRQVVATMVIVLVPLYLLTLSLFGPAFPAIVARDRTYRVAQGFSVVFGTMWRLIAGPAVVSLGLIGVAGAGGFVLDVLGLYYNSMVLLLYNTLLRTLGFLTTIVAVAVLCEMYRKTRPDPHHGQGTGAADQTPA